MQIPLFRLQCGVNSYDWGKTGHDSAAAKYAAATASADFKIEAEKPYSEARNFFSLHILSQLIYSPMEKTMTKNLTASLAMDGHPPFQPFQGRHHGSHPP